MKNKIIKMLEEKRENNCKANTDYEEKLQVAYNSTIYSKMDYRLWFGGISQIVLSIIVAMLINNPSFIFLKSFLTPITTPLILIPFSITIGEIIRKYLTRNDDKILGKIKNNRYTSDYIGLANEMYYKVKSSIEKKKIEIKDKVIDNLNKNNISCELHYLELKKDNEKLKKELDMNYERLEELIQDQVLCQEYNINQNKLQRGSSILKKALLVSLVISTLLLFSTIITGLAYTNTIIDSTIRNIIVNYIGVTSILTIPISSLLKKQQNRYDKIIYQDMGSLSFSSQYDEYIETKRQKNLIQRIQRLYYGKSKRTTKKYFDKEINDITNEIVLLETKIEENNIRINQLESTIKFSKKNNSIKPKVVSEDKKVIKFKGKIRQLIPNK